MKHGTCACLFFCVAMVAVAESSLFAQTTSPSLAKELAATWDRAAQDLIDVAEAMPEERYEFKPTPEMSTKSDTLLKIAELFSYAVVIASS